MAERAEIALTAVDRTRDAFQSAKRNLDGLKTSAAGLNASFGPLLGTVGLLSSAISLVSFKRIVDGIDALNDLHDATGASIENLSALENVAERTGTSFEDVASSLLKFQKDLIAATPGSDMATNLQAIGLSVEELKRLDPAEAYRRAAVELNKYEENGKRALQTQALFGKQTRQTAAYLKELAESGELSATVTTKQAEEAEKFNKQLFALQKNLSDAARSVASDLLPQFNEFVRYLGEADDGVSVLSLTSKGLQTVFEALAIFGANVSFTLKGVGREAGAIAAQLAALARLDFKGFAVISDAVKEDGKKARAELDAFEQRLLGLAKPQPEPKDAKKKPDAPDLADTAGAKAAAAAASKAAAEALANLRKVTDGHVKAIGVSLAQVQDEIRFGEQVSAQLYARGMESLDQFYADQDKARQDNLAALRKATDDEIAERKKLLDSPLLAGADKAADRQALQNDIADARSKLAAAEREAGQAAQLAVGERARAVAALRDEVAGLDAQIADIAAGSSGAAGDLLDIARRVAAAQRTFVQAGDSPGDASARAAQYGRLLEVQLRFNQARRAFSDISNDAARAEESLLIASRTNGDGLLETESKIGAARAKSLAELQRLIATTRELVALSPKNTDLQQYLADLELQAQRVAAALDPTKLRFDATADNIGATIADGLERATFEGGKLRDILRDIGTSVLRQIDQELITKPAAAALGDLIKGAGGQGTGGNIIAQLGQLVGLLPAGQGAGGAADRAGPDAAQTATKNIAALASAAGGSADVLGQLPSLAAIPATTALGTLAGAAQIAASALASIGASKAGSGGADLFSKLFASGGGFGTGTAFGNQDFGAYFDTGGFTGNIGVDKPAGIVHGKEYVFSAPAVERIGVGALDQMHQAARQGTRAAMLPGYASGGYVGAAQPGVGAPAAARPSRLPPMTLIFNGPADARTVQQAVLDGVRMAQRAGARGAA